MVKTGKHFVRVNQVQCIKQCGEHVWMASRAGLEDSVMDIFNKNTKELIHNFKMRENAVSCITNSDQLVYMGTMEGYCFAFPIDVATIHKDSKPHCKFISEHCIDGVALTHTCLWASTRNQIHFLNPEILDLEDVEKRTKSTHAFIGKMMLSDNGEQMWSAHLGGIIMSAWSAHQRTHITDIDVGILAEERCHIDARDKIMTAMCTALDTVWIGLANGHIMAFGMNPPGELLTFFRPYNSFICFLSASKYPGPCQTEECKMLCGGKIYRPDDPFKELTDYEWNDEMGDIVDTAGVAVLWEVLPAKYMRQVQYLSDGMAWMSYSTLEKSMTETGFTESLKHCHSAPVSIVADDNTYMESNGACSYQSDCVECQESKQDHMGLLNNDTTVKNGLSGLLTDSTAQMTDNNAAPEEIRVDWGGGHQFTLKCEQPISLKSVISKITGYVRVMGDLMLTYHLDGGNEQLVTINTNEQMEYYLQLPERPNLHVERLK